MLCIINTQVLVAREAAACRSALIKVTRFRSNYIDFTQLYSVKESDFVRKMMKFVPKLLDFVLKMLNSAVRKGTMGTCDGLLPGKRSRISTRAGARAR